MKRLAHVLCLGLIVALVACGTLGTVHSDPASDTFYDVTARVEAYAAAGAPIVGPPFDAVQFSAAKTAVEKNFSPGGEVIAGPLVPSISTICAWHDGFVQADTGLDEVHRAAYLRSSKLLFAMFERASTGK